MRESDKVFIKKTIEDTIDKKLDKFLRDNEKQNKKFQESLLSRNEKDKKQVLDNLRQRDEKGQNTLAQKIERLRLESDKITKSGGQSIKDGVHDIQSGARMVTGSVVGGVDRAISTVAQITPETAMLYNIVRGLIGAGFDITSGVLKGGGRIAWGGLKGLFGLTKGAVGLGGKGVSALLKASNKMFGNETQEETQDTPFTFKEKRIPTPQPTNDLDQPQPAEQSSTNMLKQKSKTSEQLDEMIKQGEKRDKTSKTTTQLLTKGLQGIGDTLSIVGKGIELIASKSKLILGGVLLGAVALLAIKGWIDEGGLDKLTNKIKQSMGPGRNKKSIEEANNYINNELNKIKNNTKALDDQDAKFKVGATTNINSKTTYGTPQPGSTYIPEFHEVDTKQLQQQGLTEKQAQRYKNYEQATKLTKFNNTQQGQTLSFPFETTVSQEWKYKLGNVDFKDIRVTKTNSNGSQQFLIFTKAYANTVKTGKVAANATIAKLAPGSICLGDYNSFTNKQEGKTRYQSTVEKESARISKKAMEIQDKPYHTPGVDVLDKKLDEMSGNIVNMDSNYVQQMAGFGGSKEPTNNNTTPPKNKVSESNQSSEATKKQQQQINGQQNKKSTSSNGGGQSNPTQGQNKTTVIPDGNTPTTYSTQMNTSEIQGASANRMVDKIGN